MVSDFPISPFKYEAIRISPIDILECCWIQLESSYDGKKTCVANPFHILVFSCDVLPLWDHHLFAG